MRALLVSREKTIGHSLISRVKLLNGKRSTVGALVLYCDVVTGKKKSVGKLKVIYELVDPNQVPSSFSQQASVATSEWSGRN
jgi:hypothetical protein